MSVHGKRPTSEPNTADSFVRRGLPPFDYVLLVQIDRLLHRVGLRKSHRLTGYHERVVRHAWLDSEELSDALVSAALTWYATSIVSFVLAGAFGFAAGAIQGGAVHGAAAVVLGVLFAAALTSAGLAAISTIHARLLLTSGRIRKPVSEETMVRRYWPKRWEFWLALAFSVSFVVPASLH